VGVPNQLNRSLAVGLTGLLFWWGIRSLSAEESAVIAPGQDGVQRATLTLDSYSYAPNHLVVQAGKPVDLTLISVTSITPHNFVLKEPGAGLEMDQEVGAGKTVVVRFTPTQTGMFTFYCDKKLLFFASHREKGMEGKLEVR
jgi:plastocyanin domain-containing protein